MLCIMIEKLIIKQGQVLVESAQKLPAQGEPTANWSGLKSGTQQMLPWTAQGIETHLILTATSTGIHKCKQFGYLREVHHNIHPACMSTDESMRTQDKIYIELSCHVTKPQAHLLDNYIHVPVHKSCFLTLMSVCMCSEGYCSVCAQIYNSSISIFTNTRSKMV